MKNNHLFIKFLIISLSMVLLFVIPNNLGNAEVLYEDATNYIENPPMGPIDILGNGTPIRTQAGDLLRLRTRTNFQVNATFGEDIELTLNEKDGCLEECDCELENHYRLRYMWKIETNKSGVPLDASFGFPFDPSEIPSDVAPDGFKFAFWNGTTNQWQFVYSWMNQTKNMVMANTTHFSIWTIFAELNPGPNEAKTNEINNIEGNGTPIKVQAGNTYQFRTQNKFQLNVSFNKGVELNITELAENKIQNRVETMTKEMISTGKYIEIEMNDSSVQLQATLAFEFSKSELNESIDPLKLQFAFYNEEINHWQKVESWVDEIEPNEYMIYANTTHFSLWTVIGEENESDTSVTGFSVFLMSIPFILIAIDRKRK